MGLENFTPKIWSAKIFVRLRKALVHASVVNRDYEGEIREQGDTVYINEVGAVTVNDYAKHGSLTWQKMDSMQKSLVIDQAKSFSIQYDDIDRVQNKPTLMDAFASEAGYAIADTVDQFIAGKYTEAGNTVSALTVTAGNVLTNLSNMQLKLDEANVPTAGRFQIIPPWYHQMLVQAATGIIGHTGVPKVFDNGMITNGYVGTLFGFNLLLSNNVNNNGTVWNIMAFTRSAITMAGQIANVEAVRLQDTFGDGLKGLYLYGAKVVRPAAMVKCAATRG
jgi:hypothetical protein